MIQEFTSFLMKDLERFSAIFSHDKLTSSQCANFAQATERPALGRSRLNWRNRFDDCNELVQTQNALLIMSCNWEL